MDFVYNAEKIKKCRKSLTVTEKSGIISLVYLYTDYHTYNIIQIMLLQLKKLNLNFFTRVWSEYSTLQNEHSIWRRNA